jgi:hypothetical protein
MKVIYNRVIPFRGFAAINLFGAVFTRKEFRPLKPYVLHHKAIHTAQMRETAYIFFYMLYLLEWLLKSIRHLRSAYDRISFEREACLYETAPDYLKVRRPCAWITFIFRS